MKWLKKLVLLILDCWKTDYNAKTKDIEDKILDTKFASTADLDAKVNEVKN